MSYLTLIIVVLFGDRLETSVQICELRLKKGRLNLSKFCEFNKSILEHVLIIFKTSLSDHIGHQRK
jgi:hypothetical protein